MAIQPIDLSVVYSQMDKVAQFNASQNKAAQVANQESIERAAQQNLEQSKAVSETRNDATSTKVGADGGQGGGNPGQQGKKKKPSPQEPGSEPPHQREFSDPLLGQRIDITG